MAEHDDVEPAGDGLGSPWGRIAIVVFGSLGVAGLIWLGAGGAFAAGLVFLAGVI